MSVTELLPLKARRAQKGSVIVQPAVHSCVIICLLLTALMLVLQNIMILGDFNADGQYLSKKKKEKIRIYSPSYKWLIGDDVDTTASNKNDNTYDR